MTIALEFSVHPVEECAPKARTDSIIGLEIVGVEDQDLTSDDESPTAKEFVSGIDSHQRLRKRRSNLSLALESVSSEFSEGSNVFSRCNSFESNRTSSVSSGGSSDSQDFLNRVYEASRERVDFSRCAHCKTVFPASAPSISDGNSRHLFCSGECYITKFAVLRSIEARRAARVRF